MSKQQVIKPGIGRILHFYPDNHTLEPQAAIVTRVWSDRCVNITVADPNGGPFSGMTSITLVQPCDPIPAHPHVRWMPFQGGQPEGLPVLAAEDVRAGTAA